jgi:hypothetical protein
MTPQILGTSRRRKSNISRGPGLIERINNPVYPKEPVVKEETLVSENGKELLGKLGWDETGKPKLELITLEKIAVHTSTQTEYDVLIQIYECGGWIFWTENLPTENNLFSNYKEETCIGMADNFAYAGKLFYQDRGWNIISPQEFYKIQKISANTLAEINNWFKTNKPDRGSKG